MLLENWESPSKGIYLIIRQRFTIPSRPKSVDLSAALETITDDFKFYAFIYYSRVAVGRRNSSIGNISPMQSMSNTKRWQDLKRLIATLPTSWDHLQKAVYEMSHDVLPDKNEIWQLYIVWAVEGNAYIHYLQKDGFSAIFGHVYCIWYFQMGCFYTGFKTSFYCFKLPNFIVF